MCDDFMLFLATSLSDHQATFGLEQNLLSLARSSRKQHSGNQAASATESNISEILLKRTARRRIKTGCQTLHVLVRAG